MQPSIQPIQPRKETFTRWFNPLPTRQRILIASDHPRFPFEFVIGAGETKLVPSRYDQAIQRLKPKPPNADPNMPDEIMGGLAPQLINLDAKEAGRLPILPDSLNTQLVERQNAELELASNRAALEQLEKATIISAARVAAKASATPTTAKTEDGMSPAPPEGNKNKPRPTER